MKTFKDLKFKTHAHPDMFDTHARINFENNYGISVITGGYGDKNSPYEIAVLYDNKITYNTYITDDVIGYNNEKSVTRIMKQIQELT
jgi:hypothetical protein